ncbi:MULTISPECIES: DUF302 domain-containing protein [Salimicrobium]|uniref:Uncharacterized conserved protein, DUF302 family n=2 Tax=Salimicrobium TaxID=351195 RepID=A0ABY1KUG1_9BACI|nr:MULTISPECIES: DUF302 domain-containing protein [Salimicrobium]SDX85001.1 Uncharacterized conserved protein, DUF302 family [Salimicrobium album]SIS79862.1 Uncharacterized conserved protein, DUF302 family [Salimicrobium salexigens]
MFHYTVETDKNLEEAVESLQASLQEAQFGVLWNFDVKETLQGKGLDFDTDYRILEVCNPKEAKHILEKDLLAGYFLPCKMVVYNDQGQIKIGMPKPTSLMEMIDDKEIKDVAADIEERLKVCIDNAA